MPFHTDWRLCSVCNAIFHDGTHPGSVTRGRCAGTGSEHQPEGFNFQLEHDHPETAGWRGHWRSCLHCQELVFFGYGPRPAGCPGNAAGHEASGHSYVLSHTGAEDLGHQGGWELCGKCSALFSTRHGGGVCALSDTHIMAPEAHHFILAHDGQAGLPSASAFRGPRELTNAGGTVRDPEVRSTRAAALGAWAPTSVHAGWSRCVR